MSSNNPITPSAAQIQAINASLEGLGGMNRLVMQDKIRELSAVLKGSYIRCYPP